MSRRVVSDRQLDLFAWQPSKVDCFGPVSPNTGGGLSAVEAGRVFGGRSCLIVGWLVPHGGPVFCAPCRRVMVAAVPAEPLFESRCSDGRRDPAAEVWVCALCARLFEGSRAPHTF